MRRTYLSRLTRSADRFASAVTFRAACEITARQHGLAPDEVRAGIAPGDVHRVALAARGLGDRRLADVVRARHEALYLAVVVFGRGVKSTARAARLAPKAVRLAIQGVEDKREEPRYDRHLDELELSLMEAA